jgi:hypothetical protein
MEPIIAVGSMTLPMSTLSATGTVGLPPSPPSLPDPSKLAEAFLNLSDLLQAAQGVWEAVAGWIAGFLAAWSDLADEEPAA